MSSPKNEADLQ
jgi:hypothetical protein